MKLILGPIPLSLAFLLCQFYSQETCPSHGDRRVFSNPKVIIIQLNTLPTQGTIILPQQFQRNPRAHSPLVHLDFMCTLNQSLWPGERSVPIAQTGVTCLWVGEVSPTSHALMERKGGELPQRKTKKFLPGERRTSRQRKHRCPL